VVRTGASYPVQGDPLKVLEDRFKNLNYIPIPGVPMFTGTFFAFDLIVEVFVINYIMLTSFFVYIY
jgi:hypothetical protein